MRQDGEDLSSYFARVEDPLFDTFQSVHSIEKRGESVEVHFDPEHSTCDADWKTFEDSGLCASLVRMKTKPAKLAHWLGPMTPAVSERPELVALKRWDGEEDLSYYQRAKESLFDTFQSIHSVRYKFGDNTIEVHFDPENNTCDADWAAFEDAGLCASLVRLKTKPDRNMREVGLTAPAVSSAERALCIGEEMTRLHDAALLAMGDPEEYRACRPPSALPAMQAYVAAVDARLPELEQLAREAHGETKEQCTTILDSVKRLRGSMNDLVNEALGDNAREELREVLAKIQRRLETPGRHATQSVSSVAVSRPYQLPLTGMAEPLADACLAVLVESMPDEVFVAADLPNLARTVYVKTNDTSALSQLSREEFDKYSTVYVFGSYYRPEQLGALAAEGICVVVVAQDTTVASHRYKDTGVAAIVSYAELGVVLSPWTQLVLSRNTGDAANRSKVEHFLKGYYAEFSGHGDRVAALQKAKQTPGITQTLIRHGEVLARRDAEVVAQRVKGDSATTFVFQGHKTRVVVGVTELISETKLAAARFDADTEIGMVLVFNSKAPGWAVKMTSEKVDVMELVRPFGGGGFKKPAHSEAGFMVDAQTAATLFPFLGV